MKSDNGNRKVSSALGGVLDLILSQIFTKAITFIFLVAFLRILSREELAVIPLYFAMSTASTLLFSFGIPATLIREVPRLRVTDPIKMHSLLLTATIFVLSGVIFSTFLAYIFGAQIQNAILGGLSEKTEFTFFLAAMVAGGWKVYLTFVLKSLQMFRGMALFVSLSDLLAKAFGLFGLVIYGVNGLLAGFFFGSLIVNIYTTIKLHSFMFSSTKLYPLSSLLRISWPFYFESYVNYFRINADVFVINSLLGPAALGVYYVAKRLYEILVVLISSVEHVIAPSLAKLLGNSVESVVMGYDKLMALVPIVVAPICLLCAGLGYWFVDIIAPEYSVEAYLTCAAFCLVAFIRNLAAIRIATVFVVCRPIDRLKIALSQFVVYFLTLYFMVTRIGILGAAVALGCSYIFGSLYAARMLHPVIGKRKPDRLVVIVLFISILGMLALIGLQLAYYSLLIAPIYSIIIAVLVVVAILAIASEEDLARVKGMLPEKLESGFTLCMKIRQNVLGKRDTG